jgi:hypothetical protein
MNRPKLTVAVCPHFFRESRDPIHQATHHGNCRNGGAKERRLPATGGQNVYRRRVRHSAFYRSCNFRIPRPP